MVIQRHWRGWWDRVLYAELVAEYRYGLCRSAGPVGLGLRAARPRTRTYACTHTNTHARALFCSFHCLRVSDFYAHCRWRRALRAPYERAASVIQAWWRGARERLARRRAARAGQAAEARDEAVVRMRLELDHLKGVVAELLRGRIE